MATTAAAILLANQFDQYIMNSQKKSNSKQTMAENVEIDNQKKYIFPTIAVISAITLIIFILASGMSIILKILSVILIVVLVAVFFAQNQNYDLLNLFSSKSDQKGTPENSNLMNPESQVAGSSKVQ